MTFIRRKIVKGRVYLSEEERYRENGKVKSRYIRSLREHDRFIDRSIAGHASEVQDLQVEYDKMVYHETAERNFSNAFKEMDLTPPDFTAVPGMSLENAAQQAAPSATTSEPSNTNGKDVGQGDVGEAGGDKGGDVGGNDGGQGTGGGAT